MTRTNRIGLSYELHSDYDGQTEIRHGMDYIFVDASIDRIMEAWDAWTAGVLVQNAFHFFNADEREFIMTGITSAKWDEMFKETEDAE